MADVRKYLRDIYNQLYRIHDVLCDMSGSTPPPEFDTATLCNPDDGSVVIAVTSYSTVGVPTVNYYLPNGTPYTGPTPVSCDDAELESDAREGCYLGVPITQWVVKSDGQPTGVVYYTDGSTGAVVPAPPPGGFVVGDCTSRASDEERVCYTTDGGVTVLEGWRRFVKDGQGNVVSAEILDASGAVVPTAVETQCREVGVFDRVRCDDVNGDGSLIVRFIEFYVYNPNTNTTTVVGRWLEDLSAPYTPANPGDCGGRVAVQAGEELIGVGTWTRPASLVQSVTVIVRSVGDEANRPTFTDFAGRTCRLYTGDSLSWGAPEGASVSVNWLTGNFVVSNNTAGDYILITWIELI